MRCWASFAVVVAALIGIPYQAVASTPSAVTISAAEESTADSDSLKSKPARYSLGDKSSANGKSGTASSTKTSPSTGSTSKVVRKLGDSPPASQTASRPANSPAPTSSSKAASEPKVASVNRPATRKLNDTPSAPATRSLRSDPAPSSEPVAPKTPAASKPTTPAVMPKKLTDAEPQLVHTPYSPKPAAIQAAPTTKAPTAVVSAERVAKSSPAPQPQSVAAKVTRSLNDQRPLSIAAAPTRSAPVQESEPRRVMLPQPVATTQPTLPQVATSSVPRSAPTTSRKIADTSPQVAKTETTVAPAKPPISSSPVAAALAASPAKSEPVGTGVSSGVRRSLSSPAAAESSVVVSRSPASVAPESPVSRAFHVPQPVVVTAPADTFTQVRASTAPVAAMAEPPSVVRLPPVRRSLVVQPATQSGPTPAVKTPNAVPQPEPEQQASKSPAPVMSDDGYEGEYYEGDYCEACEDCKYGMCDLHRDLKAMSRNMHPHYPYVAQPWTYYYFRPYNYTHVKQQQEEAAGWGADPAQPYGRKLFDKVYEDLEKQMKMADGEDDDEN
jgi:hypothetical protein